jgi:3'-phosphoadenosine 5'-phosphosulfate (PAPS) 3'-phosphatase
MINFINYIFVVLCPYIYYIFLSHKAKGKNKETQKKKKEKTKKQKKRKTKKQKKAKRKNKETQKTEQKKTVLFYPWRTAL